MKKKKYKAAPTVTVAQIPKSELAVRAQRIVDEVYAMSKELPRLSAEQKSHLWNACGMMVGSISKERAEGRTVRVGVTPVEEVRFPSSGIAKELRRGKKD